MPPFEIWGLRGWGNTDVVGESHYEKEIRKLFPGRVTEESSQVSVPVRLIHEPTNPHDRNAVQVRADSGVVGYLKREDAARYATYLAALQEGGFVAQTTATIWGRVGEDWETRRAKFWGNVRVELPEPHMLSPVNKAPAEPHRMLPPGGAIQVTGEEEHLDALVPLLNSEGCCWAHATLHAVEDEKARTPRRLVEVQVDGRTVGRLTPKMSSELLPAVDFLDERGEVSCVRAKVTGNRLKAEVVLQTMRAHEITAEWFDSIEREPATPEAAPAVMAASVEPLPQPTPQLPPADWYPDPHGVARLRYWDGQRWTGHTAD